MNSYRSVFSLPDPQNNRNQFEIPKPKVETIPVTQTTTIPVDQTTTAIPQPKEQIDPELVLKFLAEISKDPVNEHKSSKEKFEIAIEMVKSLQHDANIIYNLVKSGEGS